MSEGEASSEQEEPQDARLDPSPQNIFENKPARWWEGGQKVKVGEAFTPRRLDTPLDKMMRHSGGRRSRTRSDRRGRYIMARPSPDHPIDLALDATLRAAAPFQNERAELRRNVAFSIRPSDYMRKVRVRRAANLVLFLVDASWSMAVAERMAATKGAILSLLTDAYQRRDRVGLIVFQKDRATLVLPPTNSVFLAKRALEEIPVGGKTPLSAGLLMAHEVLRQEKITHPDVMPLMMVLTDGAGNVAMGQQSPQDEAHRLAESIAEEKIHSVVINMEHVAFDQGLAQQLADHLDAPCYAITDLRAESLYLAVKQEINQAKPEDRR
jgi:Mg-chelatase subunit ChlD